MKKWIIRIVIGGVVVLLAVLAIIYFNLNTLVKKGVETVGPNITKTPVKLEAANISPFSGSGELKGFVVGNPSGYKSPSAISVGSIKVSLVISSAFSDVVTINSVNVQSPEITFEGGLTGNNLKAILDNLNAAGGGEKPGEKAPPEQGGQKYKVKDFVVDGAKVHINITALTSKTVTVTLPSLHLQNIGTDSGGVTAAELSRQVIKPLLASVMKAVTENASALGGQLKDIGKDIAKDPNGQIEKATKGLKGLFKK
jgi:hypothetical protein